MASCNGGFQQHGKEFPTEDRVHQDYLFCLTHANWCLMKLPENLRKKGGEWVKRLIKVKPRNVTEMKIRNMHFVNLLLDMSFGKLRGLYSQNPPQTDEPLPPVPTTAFIDKEGPAADESNHPEQGSIAQPPEWVMKLIEGCEPAPEEATDPQICHTSKDGRLYIATKALPGHPGAYGFLSMSRGSGDGMGSGCPTAVYKRGSVDVRRTDRRQEARCAEGNPADWQQGEDIAGLRDPFFPDENPSMRRAHSTQDRKVSGVIQRAREDLQAEFNVEFRQKLACIRDNIQLDLSHARANYQRARLSYEMASMALDKARAETERVIEESRSVTDLLNQLDVLEGQKKMNSGLIAEGMKDLYEIGRRVRDIKACRRRELDDLKGELHLKQLYLADMIKFYEGTLIKPPECPQRNPCEGSFE